MGVGIFNYSWEKLRRWFFFDVFSISEYVSVKILSIYTVWTKKSMNYIFVVFDCPRLYVTFVIAFSRGRKMSLKIWTSELQFYPNFTHYPKKSRASSAIDTANTYRDTGLLNHFKLDITYHTFLLIRHSPLLSRIMGFKIPESFKMQFFKRSSQKINWSLLVHMTYTSLNYRSQ